jgi:hypothetical protein
MTLSTVLLLLAAVAPASAAPGMLDLVPDDANAAIMIQSIASLKKKGDKFIEDTEMNQPFRFSDGFKFLYDFLGIHAGVDEDQPGGLLLVHDKYGQEGNQKSLDRLILRLVLVVPFSDRDKIAGNFFRKVEGKAGEHMLKGDDLPAGKVQKVTANGNFRGQPIFVAIRDKHLFLALHEPAVKSVAQSKPLTRILTGQQARSVETSDVLLLFQPIGELGKDWKEQIKAEDQRTERDAPPVDPAIRGQFRDAMTDVQCMFLGVRLEDGLQFRALATYSKDTTDGTKKFLSLLQGSTGSNLTGLPDGSVILAQAAQGSGVHSAAVLKIFFYHALRTLGPGNARLPFWTDQLDPSQRLTVVGIVSEVWKQLQGHRAAIYRNADPRQGLFSVVAILDTDNASRFLGEVRQLARFAGAQAIDLSDKGAKDDLQLVKQLVKDLDDRRFSVRESATTKLEVIGEPVVAYLDDVLKGKPPLEVRRRVEAIKSRIAVAVKERRKGLLSDVARRLEPSFSYIVKAEMRDDVAVDVLHIKLADKDVPASKQFAYLFGPQWDKVRVAVHGKQVVIVWGSDPALLSTALRNLKDGKPGLAASKDFASFVKSAEPGRKIELHASMQALLWFKKAEDVKQPPASGLRLSSLALTVDPSRMQFDLHLPAKEFKVFTEEMNRAARPPDVEEK